MVAAPDLLGGTRGPVLLARLPVHGVSHQDAMAARWYGSYLLSCIVAAARWRLRSGTSAVGGPPLLLVLQDAAVWVNTTTIGLLSAHMEALGRAEIALLVAGGELPGGTEGEWLLDNTGTWWVHSLKRDGAGMVGERLRHMGIAADLALTTMPSGVAVLKFQGLRGPIAATVYTGDTSPKVVQAPRNKGGEDPDPADFPSLSLRATSDELT